MRNCKCCGKEFDEKSTTRLYCSPECYNKVNKERARARSKGIQVIEKECLFCGSKFKQMGHSQIYCSPKCGKAMRKSIRKKEPRKPKQKLSSLREMTIEARKHGMSYGKYVALKERGIKL